MKGLNLTLTSSHEDQIALTDCNAGDCLFIYEENHHLHMYTSWGDDLGELPLSIEKELMNDFDSGIGINAKIKSIVGEFGERRCSIEIYTNSKLDDYGKIISIH